MSIWFCLFWIKTMLASSGTEGFTPEAYIAWALFAIADALWTKTPWRS